MFDTFHTAEGGTFEGDMSDSRPVITPAGSGEKTSPRRRVASGVSSLGFTMHVLPVASAAAACQASSTSG